MAKFQRWLDSAYNFIKANGPTTCEGLRANVVNYRGLPYTQAPNYQQVPMWLRSDKRFIMVGHHINEGRGPSGPYPVQLWGIKDEK